MTLKELIAELQQLANDYGDLPVVIYDDAAPNSYRSVGQASFYDMEDYYEDGEAFFTNTILIN